MMHSVLSAKVCLRSLLAPSASKMGADTSRDHLPFLVVKRSKAEGHLAVQHLARQSAASCLAAQEPTRTDLLMRRRIGLELSSCIALLTHGSLEFLSADVEVQMRKRQLGLGVRGARGL